MVAVQGSECFARWLVDKVPVESLNILSGPLYPNTLSVLWSRRWTLVSLVTIGRLSFDHNKIQRVE